jgi:type IV pilus assembly protein PilC
MTKFDYTAVASSGKQKAGTIESTSETSAKQMLLKLGLRPLVIKKHGETNKAMSFLNKSSGKVKSKDLVVFTRQLATMINAGVPLVRSLATMQNQTENPALKAHLMQISKDVEGGTAFAAALEKHNKVFSPIYINMIRAGEVGGILDEILKKLALQQEKDAAIRAKFKGAMTYPIVLIGITVIVFIALMTVVVPKVGTIIADLTNGELPAITKVMLNISNFLIKFWWLHLSVVVFGSIALRRYIKTPKGRANKDRLLLKIPAVKILITKMAVARFSRIFASLMSAGVSVIEAIEITAKAIGNVVIEDELMAAAKRVANI